MTLRATVDFHNDELAALLPSRLAIANGYSSGGLFSRTGRIDVRGVCEGRAEALEKLTRWSGIAEARLGALPMRSINRSLWTLGEATFDKKARPGRRHRYCSVCVVDDIEHGTGLPLSRAYVRASWMTKDFRNCDVHHRPLSEVPYSGKGGGDFNRFVAHNLADIQIDAAKEHVTRSTLLDGYVRDRIHGVGSEPFLDGLETYAVVRLCTYFGAFVKSRGVVKRLSNFDLRDLEAREIGYGIVRHGEARMREAVRAVVAKARPTDQKQAFFGTLGQWLRRNMKDPAIASVVDFLQDEAERNMPLAEGEVCIMPARKRYLHSIRSASIEFGLDEPRVLRLVSDAGLVADTKTHPSRIYFDADRSRSILLSASRTMTSKEARVLLNVTEKRMAQILKAKLIESVERGNKSRLYARIESTDVQAFQVALFEKAVPSDDDTLCSVTDICQKCGGSYDEVLRLVIDREVKNIFALPNHTMKVDDLRLDPQEVISVIIAKRREASKETHDDLMTARQAEQHLRIASRTRTYLVKAGFIETKVVTNIEAKFSHAYISKKSLEKFQALHISMGDLAAQLGTHAIRIEKMLSKKGVRPLFEDAGRVARFYRKADLAPLNIFKL